MNTAIGIAGLVVCAIGMCSIASWFFTARRKWLAPYNNTTRLIKIGHLRTPTPYDQVPQFKGETGMFGLPRYRYVMVPNKHNYATVVYMDHPIKQWVYDVMATWKGLCDEVNQDGKFKTAFGVLFFPVLAVVAGASIVTVLLILAAIIAVLYLWYIPSGMPMTRRSAENAKNFTPETWRGIYRDVAESIEREDELARAIRKSGVRRWRY